MSAQYFAQIDDNNIVTHIAVVQQEFLEANPERYTGRWVETFFDTAGKTYAGIGYEYLEDEQDFRTVTTVSFVDLGEQSLEPTNTYADRWWNVSLE
jgi:hypothetical protein